MIFFKGSSAAVGLEEVRKSALQLESLSRNGDFKNAQKYFPRFVQELHEGSELLRQYLELQKKAQWPESLLSFCNKESNSKLEHTTQ